MKAKPLEDVNVVNFEDEAVLLAEFLLELGLGVVCLILLLMFGRE